MESPLHLSTELEQRLTQFAQDGSPETLGQLREAILDEIEDLVDYHLAEQAMVRIRNGSERAVPWNDVRKELGLDD